MLPIGVRLATFLAPGGGSERPRRNGRLVVHPHINLALLTAILRFQFGPRDEWARRDTSPRMHGVVATGCDRSPHSTDAA